MKGIYCSFTNISIMKQTGIIYFVINKKYL